MGDDDILSQGEERKPGSWPGRVAAVVALAVVATVVIVANLPRHQHAPARPHRAASTAGRTPVPPVNSAISVTGLPGRPDGVIGPTLPWTASLRLPVTGRQPAWFYPATGRRVPIGGLPPARSGYLFTQIGGGWAIQPDAPAGTGCGGCPGPPAPVYILLDQDQSVTRAGEANRVAPAATAGAAWLTSYPPGADMSTSVATAQEVSSTGRPLRPAVRLPAGYLIDRATSRGLLLAPVLPGLAGTGLRLWDPGRAQTTRTFARLIAASATEIAWTPPCSRQCRARVLNLATGRDTVITLPPGSSAANAAFSPDGAFLALQVSAGSGGDGGALAMQLAVARVAGGRLTLVPGTWASSDALVGFGWPGGDSLVAELSFTTKVQITSWRPGAARLAVAVVGPRQDSGSLIVG
jgi:hypothetical protein